MCAQGCAQVMGSKQPRGARRKRSEPAVIFGDLSKCDCVDGVPSVRVYTCVDKCRRVGIRCK